MKRLLRRASILLLCLIVPLWLLALAIPERSFVAEGYELIHFRGNGGMTYVINEDGIKLTGPVIRELQVTEDEIHGLSGKNGTIPFSIDRRTGEISHDVSH